MEEKSYKISFIFPANYLFGKGVEVYYDFDNEAKKILFFEADETGHLELTPNCRHVLTFFIEEKIKYSLAIRENLCAVNNCHNSQYVKPISLNVCSAQTLANQLFDKLSEFLKDHYWNHLKGRDEYKSLLKTDVVGYNEWIEEKIAWDDDENIRTFFVIEDEKPLTIDNKNEK